MGKILFLDWNKHTLYGWERKKSRSVVDAIIKGIEAGYEFPAVPVHQEDDSTYYLSPLRETDDGLADGGHHRAIGHYLSRKPLKCELLYGGPIFPDEMCIAIQDIKIVDDTGDYEERKKRFPGYR